MGYKVTVDCDTKEEFEALIACLEVEEFTGGKPGVEIIGKESLAAFARRVEEQVQSAKSTEEIDAIVAGNDDRFRDLKVENPEAFGKTVDAIGKARATSGGTVTSAPPNTTTGATKADVLAILQRVAEKHGGAKAKLVLAKVGVSKMSELQPGYHDLVITEAKAVLSGIKSNFI